MLFVLTIITVHVLLLYLMNMHIIIIIIIIYIVRIIIIIIIIVRFRLVFVIDPRIDQLKSMSFVTAGIFKYLKIVHCQITLLL